MENEETSKDIRIKELEAEVERLKEIIIYQSCTLANLKPEQVSLKLKKKK